MILHKDSHLDHALTDAQRDLILKRYANREHFFIDTFELPEELGTVPCGLYGPSVGDDPIHKTCVEFLPRGDRKYPSRILIGALLRPTRTVTVIAGPHDEEIPGGVGGLKVHHSCILYTAFGGPLAPKEVEDPTLSETERSASIAFWKLHALAV